MVCTGSDSAEWNQLNLHINDTYLFSECSPLSSTPFGSIYGNMLSVGSTRGFRCNEGLKTSIREPITCQSNGQWSEQKLNCTNASIGRSVYVLLPSKRRG